jgi:hypothetical protein
MTVRLISQNLDAFPLKFSHDDGGSATLRNFVVYLLVLWRHSPDAHHEIP